jgi:hypothetical protein
MREIIARSVSLLTLIVVVALSHVFAERHNPNVTEPIQAQARPPVVLVAEPVAASAAVRGREIYDAQGCSSCHAIAGVGNPRNPLDDVGSRRTAIELREWITGAGSATDQLSPAVVRRKQRYRSMPEAELQALVSFLVGLTKKP